MHYVEKAPAPAVNNRHLHSAIGTASSAAAAGASSVPVVLNMNSDWYSIKNCVDRFTSTNNVYTRRMSCTSTSPAFRFIEASAAVVICRQTQNEIL